MQRYSYRAGSFEAEKTVAHDTKCPNCDHEEHTDLEVDFDEPGYLIFDGTAGHSSTAAIAFVRDLDDAERMVWLLNRHKR